MYLINVHNYLNIGIIIITLLYFVLVYKIGTQKQINNRFLKIPVNCQ